MDYDIDITHELIGKDVRYFKKNKFGAKEKIANTFERVDSISVVEWNKMGEMYRVEGTIHLYGYKVDNGGFF